MQPKLPLRVHNVQYECVNPNCFYESALLDFDDLVWKHLWCSQLEGLELVPYCPSCNDPVIFWSED